METLRIMVRSIVVIIIIAAFLEIVLPKSDMKRYINLIIGLFIIIAVLNPFLAMFHQDLTLDVLNITPADGETADTQTLIRKGREIASSQQAGVARQYKEKLAKQVQAVAEVYQKNGVDRVEIDMIEDTTQADFGKVRKITVYLKGQGEKGRALAENGNAQAELPGAPAVDDIKVDNISISPLAPGQAGGNAGNADNNGGVGNTRGLREIIADFYGLTTTQVIIQ